MLGAFTLKYVKQLEPPGRISLESKRSSQRDEIVIKVLPLLMEALLNDNRGKTLLQTGVTAFTLTTGLVKPVSYSPPEVV